jgi:tetratricopeptide (TPR) repeat protein
MPGWGMLANSLLALAQYRESLECCEKILKSAPNLFAWYEKGYCCYHLGQFQEALQCFDKVLAECSDKESTLREDVALHRRIVEAMLDRQTLDVNAKAQPCRAILGE